MLRWENEWWENYRVHRKNKNQFPSSKPSCLPPIVSFQIDGLFFYLLLSNVHACMHARTQPQGIYMLVFLNVWLHIPQLTLKVLHQLVTPILINVCVFPKAGK